MRIKNFINDNQVDFERLNFGDFFEWQGHIFVKLDDDELDWCERVTPIPPTEYSFTSIGKCKFSELKLGETFNSEGNYVKISSTRAYWINGKMESLRNFTDWEVTKTAFVWEEK